MKAVELIDRRVVVSTDAFIELVVWRVGEPVTPSSPRFKYRLAYVVCDRCVLRCDKERGKGDHRHIDGVEKPYRFVSVGDLLEDFSRDVARWNHENGRA
ncbi:MAG: hypothetical protein FJ178_08865 [Gammaproteobacteria bacterium]|nr:hypothetical protein [Gammaproteobacteria bacterium]